MKTLKKISVLYCCYDVNVNKETLPSCACGKTLKFACAFVSSVNSGTFNLPTSSVLGTRNTGSCSPGG